MSPAGVPIPDTVRWSHLSWVACSAVVALGAVVAMVFLPAALRDLTTDVDGDGFTRAFLVGSSVFTPGVHAGQIVVAVAAVWVAGRMRDGENWARILLTTGLLPLAFGFGAFEISGSTETDAIDRVRAIENVRHAPGVVVALVAAVPMWVGPSAAYSAAHRRPARRVPPGPGVPPPAGPGERRTPPHEG